MSKTELRDGGRAGQGAGIKRSQVAQESKEE